MSLASCKCSHSNDILAANIIKEATKRGLTYSTNYNESQILFMQGSGPQEHIQRKAQCNLYLDIHKYNGHSTSADILWAGVPMVTFPGQSIAARAAGSFAWSAGFPEM
jgi:predicted O-linked N-acetylglucosamine transferase (SPINDLY family)